MGRSNAAQLLLATILTSVAGWTDAVGAVHLGATSISFMSGDTLQIGLAAAARRGLEALAALGVATLFVMGVAAGRLVYGGAGPRGRHAVLILVAALLLAAVLVLASGGGTPRRTTAAAALVLAMGAQNAVLVDVGVARAGLTYVTGTLVHLGEALADAAGGEARFRSAAPYLALWGGFAVGAAGGAWSYGRAGFAALLVPAAGAALLSLGPGAAARRLLAARSAR